jgi:hypothetical protein
MTRDALKDFIGLHPPASSLVTSYSITWSARSSSDCGIVRAERLGDPEVDDQLELGRLLPGQVAWLRAFEDFVHIASNTPGVIAKIVTVRQQSADLREVSVLRRDR